MARKRTSLIISGPTRSHGLPPFSWSPPFDRQSHVGLPKTYDFDWELTYPRLWIISYTQNSVLCYGFGSAIQTVHFSRGTVFLGSTSPNPKAKPNPNPNSTNPTTNPTNSIDPLTSTLNLTVLMALNGLCAYVPLRNYSFTLTLLTLALTLTITSV